MVWTSCRCKVFSFWSSFSWSNKFQFHSWLSTNLWKEEKKRFISIANKQKRKALQCLTIKKTRDIFPNMQLINSIIMMSFNRQSWFSMRILFYKFTFVQNTFPCFPIGLPNFGLIYTCPFFLHMHSLLIYWIVD